jgi:uncharacterized membrane protein YuzA (DUF378 family)
MDGDKLRGVMRSIEKSFISIFHIGVGIINVGITAFLIFGAFASILLLQNMFPDVYLILYKPMVIIFRLLFQMLKAVYFFLLGLAALYLIITIKDIFNKQIKKREKERELDRKKFMDQVVKRLKMENKR